ncbi:hypothetical protein C173_18776 [Paenibacillus sp. FSL R7-277]|uniref:Uncharacterized protein n=1 Tax=Paenibacillus silagei TaxID=1670801 RepID=A0ABS4NNE5_9BACL|nr:MULTISPECIES: hypothetical protein [Paenibacillus]ETT66625.1 hypothetical protein C173_18776 [Paenibacillus sp. FSL R7-277]MBP2110892.1 hypothetical protein [Paenibacillus silagei]OMF97870.1 hypothetical protein BK146_12990 [Paenibacillus sp. FSL R7-0333]
MNSRTSRTQMMYTLGFLFFLISAFASFFTGVKVGADKTEAKYSQLKDHPSAQEFSGSYQQQDLVTFYHNVFLPYREFKRNWNEQVGVLARSTDARQNAATLKNLSILADKQYDKVTQDSLFTNSPMLYESQLNILKSLTLFSQASSKVTAGASGAEAAKVLRSDNFTTSAVRFGLLAQKNFYDSMLKWGSKTHPSIPQQSGELKTLSFIQWKKMPLLLKNASIANIMLNRGIYAGYDPQDITAKIDDMIYSGTASSLKLNDIQSSVTLLISTGAVQEQDFIKWREQYYGKEIMPQLPFFYE